jgi:DNA invertase Pin-like site-specific DNA recombinase
MDNTKKQLKYACYRRKSSEEKDRQVLSLESQKRELEKLAETLNLKIVTSFEESQSAYKHGRLKFNKMVEMIRAGKVNAILVYHITRLARNMTDGGIIIDMLKDGELLEIRTPNEVYSKNSGQEFILALQFAMSKKTSDDTSEFVKRDIQTKLNKGELPSMAPLGYLNIDSNDKIAGKQHDLEKYHALIKLNRKLKRVEKDPLLAPLVVKLFELCSEGRSTLDQLRNEMHMLGLSGVRSRKKLSKQTIHRMLTNPFYYGGIRWMGRIWEPEELPENTRHDPLISRALFERVQSVLGLKSKPFKAKRFYTYTNYIHCSDCGGNISGLTTKGHVYYRCTKCTDKSYIREVELEKEIIKHVKSITIDEDFYKLAMEEINKANEEEIKKKDLILDQQHRAVNRCNEKMDNLIRLKISPDNRDGLLLSDGEFLKQKQEILLEQSDIKEKLNDTEANVKNWYDLCVNYVDFAKNLAKKFETGSPEIKRDIFKFVYYNPTLKEKVLNVSIGSPHKYIAEYNALKTFPGISVITTENPFNKRETNALSDGLSTRRGVVDKIITFFKQNPAFYICKFN